MPERVTHDIDIAIRVSDSTEVRRRLKAAGFDYEGELSIGCSSWTSPDGTVIDVIEGEDSWWTEALAEAQSNRDLQGLPVLPLRFLVLMKFQAGRVQGFADVTRMLGQTDEESLMAIRSLFAKIVPGDRKDLESLIALGKLEMQS